MARGSSNQLGKWAFLIGVILAVVVGSLGRLDSTWTFVLVLIGLIVGLLNISENEVQPFLLSGAVLIIASNFGGNVLNTVWNLGSILDSLLAIFVPSTIIVAIKHVFSLARN